MELGIRLDQAVPLPSLKPHLLSYLLQGAKALATAEVPFDEVEFELHSGLVAQLEKHSPGKRKVTG